MKDGTAQYNMFQDRTLSYQDYPIDYKNNHSASHSAKNIHSGNDLRRGNTTDNLKIHSQSFSYNRPPLKPHTTAGQLYFNSNYTKQKSASISHSSTSSYSNSTSFNEKGFRSVSSEENCNSIFTSSNSENNNTTQNKYVNPIRNYAKNNNNLQNQNPNLSPVLASAASFFAGPESNTSYNNSPPIRRTTTPIERAKNNSPSNMAISDSSHSSINTEGSNPISSHTNRTEATDYTMHMKHTHSSEQKRRSSNDFTPRRRNSSIDTLHSSNVFHPNNPISTRTSTNSSLNNNNNSSNVNPSNGQQYANNNPFQSLLENKNPLSDWTSISTNLEPIAQQVSIENDVNLLDEELVDISSTPHYSNVHSPHTSTLTTPHLSAQNTNPMLSPQVTQHHTSSSTNSQYMNPGGSFQPLKPVITHANTNSCSTAPTQFLSRTNSSTILEHFNNTNNMKDGKIHSSPTKLMSPELMSSKGNSHSTSETNTPPHYRSETVGSISEHSTVSRHNSNNNFINPTSASNSNNNVINFPMNSGNNRLRSPSSTNGLPQINTKIGKNIISKDSLAQCPICAIPLTMFEYPDDHIQTCLDKAERIHTPMVEKPPKLPPRSRDRPIPPQLDEFDLRPPVRHTMNSMIKGINDNNKLEKNKIEENEGSSSPILLATNKNLMLTYRISDNDVIKECPICFEDMEVGDKVSRLECLCVFHYDCIKQWEKKKVDKIKEEKNKGKSTKKKSKKKHDNNINNNKNDEFTPDELKILQNRNFCPFHDALY